MVIFIKRECDKHPGCFTMTNKCDLCIDEEFEDHVSKMFAKFADNVEVIFKKNIGRGM